MGNTVPEKDAKTETHSKPQLSCRHFPRCGGCQDLNRPYDEQLTAKRNVLSGIFKAWNIEILPVIPSPEIYFYRHKVQLPFDTNGKGRQTPTILGCYAVNSHEVVDQQECLVQDRDLSRVAWAIRTWANRSKIGAYNEAQHSGILRHVLLRKGISTQEILIGIVTNGDRPPGSRNMASSLLDTIGQAAPEVAARVVGIVQNSNKRKTNVVLGAEENTWWGRPFLKESLGALRFKLGLSTFFQVNPYQTPSLYSEVLRWIPDGARVIDLYCGVGSITLTLASKAAQVTGIEENGISVQAARDAAKLNAIRNARFIAGDAASVADGLIGGNYDHAVVDPPRKGLDDKMISVLNQTTLKRLIYVSCNPETLARDIRNLDKSFRLLSLQGVDMFPHTSHIECVAVLERVLV